jgi:diguanylate cyclase (GGDEF)-like protein
MGIVIVDDSASQRLVLTSFLKSAGYTDLVGVDSAQAVFAHLGILAEDSPRGNGGAAGLPLVDLILMDISMPGIDGIDACRQIKAAPAWQDTPIIMVTASTEEIDLELAFAAGAMDYITKPPRREDLLVRVRSALKLKYEMDRRKAREQDLLQVTRQLEIANQILQAREQELLRVTKQLAQANQILEQLSSIDQLTGIANRRQFDHTFDVEWKRALRAGLPLGLLMLDIDHYKGFNDLYGHQAGDDCLRQVARALADALRRPDDVVARYGGEEFVVILPNTTAEGAGMVAETLRAAVEALCISHDRSSVSKAVTVSLGAAAMVPDQAAAPSALLEAADQALYQAKQEGRNRVVVGARS